MTLYEKIKAIYPSLTDNDFASTIILQDDGDGPYVHSWEHPSFDQPTQAQLDALEAN